MSGPTPTEMFRQEADDLLDRLEQALLDLDQAPDSADLIDAAFRALHTIKGSGAMFGFERVAAFTHHVETAFDLVRKGRLGLNRDLIVAALAAQDHMSRLIKNPDETDDADGETILSTFRRLTEPVATDAPSVGDGKATESSPRSAGWHIRFRLPADALVNGTNPLLLLAELRTLGTARVRALTDAVPALEDMIPTDCYLAWDVVLTTEHPRAAIEQVFLFQIDEMTLDIEPLGADAEDGEVRAEDPLDRGHVAPPVPSGTPADPSAVSPDAGEQGAPPPRAQGQTVRNTDSIRVPAERLDDLMDRIGELVIAQSRLKQVAAMSDDLQVKSIAEEIERLALELRDSTMGVRMVPLGSLFGRFRRMVHDLGRELGKSIHLVTSGEDTELDKTVIERLGDPLVHLIRNAVDHGVEDQADRAKAGKPAQGRITLSARHVGAEVLISISDDGRGLDAARIQARAEENGLISAGSRLSDNELFQFIFHPGFSTAREVTSVSGRGVGMDVVKRTIETLRGSIDVTSEPKRGTTVTLRLPLTLAIIDGLLVRVGSERYVIPLAAVEECVELPPEHDGRTRGRSFLNIRGELVPFLRLRELFNATTPADRFQKIVIVSSGEPRVGLVVDQVIGEHQTVIKSLSRLHEHVGTFSGATILGDGTVALIIEVTHLVAFGQARQDRLMEAA